MKNIFPWLPARWLVALLALLALAGPALAQTTLTVTTNPVNGATESAAVVGGNLTSLGTSPVTDYGVVYKPFDNLPPVLTDSRVSVGAATSTGSYSRGISGLTSGAYYEVRAYAISNGTTYYGNRVYFATVPPAPTLDDFVRFSSGRLINTRTPTYTGTSNASTVTVYVGPSAATATSIGSVAPGGTINGPTYFSLPQPTALADGPYVVYATATNSGPGSPQSAHSSEFTFTVDGTAPTATISSTAVAAGGTVSSTAPIPFTLTFPEKVGQAMTNIVTVTNGTLSSFATASNGTTFTFNVAPATTGPTMINVAAGAVRDLAGNPNTAASFSLTYTPPTAPTVTTATPTSVVETAATLGANLTSTGGADVTDYGVVYLRYNSPALPTVNDNKVSFGPATGPRSTSQTVTGLVPGVLYTVRAYAINSVSVNPVYGAPVQFYTEPTPPTLDAANPFGSSQVINRRQFAYTGRSLTGDVTVYVGATVATATVAGTGSTAFGTAGTSSTFSVNQSTPLADGAYVAYATTKFGGSSESGRSNVISFTVDATAPTATISSTAGTSGSSTAITPFPITVTFSEPVAGLRTSSVTVTNGTLSAITAVSTTTYTFTVTPTTAGTATTVSLAANVTGDVAGNGNAATTPFSLTYSTAPVATTWTGIASTDWFTAGNWTAGVPTGSVDASIAAGAARYPVITTGTPTANNLTLASGASLTQSEGTLQLGGNLLNNGTYAASGGTLAMGSANPQTIGGSGTTRCYNLTIGTVGVAQTGPVEVARVLTLTGSLTTNGNVLTLLSSASGDALVNNAGGVVLGAATVQRYIDPSLNPGPGYRHFSAPMSTATVGDLATSGFAPVVNSAYNSSATPGATVPFPTVYGYDQSRLSLTNNLIPFDKGFFSPSSLSDRLLVGQGYTVNIAASQLVDFTGTLINSNVTLNLASNRPTNPDGGWQLVGNPYPSPLDYSLITPADRPNLEGAVWVYSSTGQYSGQYRAYINSVGGNPVLPSGQGFFVRVAAGQATGLLTFRNSHRLTTPNPTTFQRTAAETRPLVQLTLKGAGTASDDAYVYFENGASEGFDPQYDAAKLPNTTGLNLSASLGSQQLAIDGRPELGSTQRVIPLAVGVPTAGTYSLTSTQLLNLAATPVYLRDVQLGTLTDLRLTPSYQFTVSNAAALLTGRFELVLSPQQPLATVPAALAQQVALYPNPAKQAAFLELPASLGRQPVTATLVDALGRQLRTVTLPAQGTLAHQLDLTELATGVYALRLSTSAGVVVKKLVVE